MQGSYATRYRRRFTHITAVDALSSPQEQAIAENKASKATPAAKEESLAETEARLKAQMTATKDNGTEDALMQIDSDLQKPWLPILQPWIDAVAEVLPPHVLSVMGYAGFQLHWDLSYLIFIAHHSSSHFGSSRSSKPSLW